MLEYKNLNDSWTRIIDFEELKKFVNEIISKNPYYLKYITSELYYKKINLYLLSHRDYLKSKIKKSILWTNDYLIYWKQIKVIENFICELDNLYLIHKEEFVDDFWYTEHKKDLDIEHWSIEDEISYNETYYSRTQEDKIHSSLWLIEDYLEDFKRKIDFFSNNYIHWEKQPNEQDFSNHVYNLRSMDTLSEDWDYYRQKIRLH